LSCSTRIIQLAKFWELLNEKQKNITPSEQLLNLIKKNITASEQLLNLKKNITPSEQLLNVIKKKYHTIGTAPKSNKKK
jgi:hypothetical protein